AKELTWTGVGVIGVSWFIGPAVGHFYADFDRQGWIGLGIRAAGLASAGIVWAIASASDKCAPRESEMQYECGLSDSWNTAIWYSIIVPPLVLLGSGIYDMVAAPRSARRANARSNASASQLSVAPMIVRNEGQLASGGLSVVGTF
ncbi:MAG: hypothetical protein PHU25_20000, partial [Deltaproteobacteria bacterium]|nr:hypothetical protein [Deltaproteobacteria bacterium]